MTPEQFAYWLQGFSELNTGTPTGAQWKSIREHLSTVFLKKTPDYGPIRNYPLPPPNNPFPSDLMNRITC